eukprot:9264148-Alexandrium_andersonii.AAC.1
MSFAAQSTVCTPQSTAIVDKRLRLRSAKNALGREGEAIGAFKRTSQRSPQLAPPQYIVDKRLLRNLFLFARALGARLLGCLLYTSDAADDM